MTLAIVVALAPWALAQQQGSQAQQTVRITNGPVVENLTENSVIVAWSTNVNASTTVKYGTDRNNLDQTAEAPWGGLTHRVTLRNLKPGSTYYYQAISGQGSGTGTGAMSAIQSLQTKGSGQQAAAPRQEQQAAGGQQASTGQAGTAAALQAGPIPQDVTDRSARLWWTTDQGAETKVKYGTDPNNLDKMEQKPWGQKEHMVELRDLQPDTTYHFQIVRENGNEVARGAFKTQPANYAQDRTVDIIDGPVIEYLDDDAVVIAWSTNVRSSSTVRYGTDPNTLDQTAQAAWGAGGQTHRVQIKPLKPNTRYYFRVESSQAERTGTMVRSDIGEFNTMAPGQQALRNTQSRR